jgi:tetratricopeptide (TPR) repeat protein
MRNLRYWPLMLLLLGLAGCSGAPAASTTRDKSAESIENGNAALARHEFDRALEEFTAAVDAQPDSALALERRAATYLHMKKFDSALIDCNNALKIDNKLAAAYIVRGEVETGHGDKEKAIDDFTKALEYGGERADVLTERGTIYYSQSKTCRVPDEAAKILQTAMKDFERAVKIDPNRAGARLQRALARLDSGDYSGAVADCDAAIQSDPNLVDAYVARARGQCELGDIDRAVTDCDTAIHRDANCMEAYAVRAKARLEKASDMRTVAEIEQCSQAVDDCQRAIELSKKVPGDQEGADRGKSIGGLAHEIRGRVYENLRLPKRALEEYGRALSLDPYLVSALVWRAVSRVSAKDFTGALNDCNAAISLDSARPDAYSGRGTIYVYIARSEPAVTMAKTDLDKAISDFTQAVQLDPRSAKAFHGRAMVYGLKASMALAEAKKSKDAAERQVGLQQSQELRRRCVEDATEAIKANRHVAKAYLTRALSYCKLDMADKALADFTSAIREDPKMLLAYYNRAVLFAQKGFVDAAVKDFNECENLAPENPLVAYRLLQCYDAKQDRILAPKYAQRFKELQKRARPTVSLEDPTDFLSGPKTTKLPEVKPDDDLDPLEKAKSDLEHKLDATKEK